MQMAMEVAEKTFAWATLLSPLSRQGVIAGLINPLAGCEVVPLPLLVEKLYTASEIGKLFDVSANKIGRIANDNNMKTEHYGEYHLDKSRHSDKQVQAFRYNNHAVNTFRHILIAEQEAKEHALV
ncbi:putative phage antirepressor [Candidatus Regiella insecticola LSR1]|uniref:Putative phage antirepressor n=2 Tax=Candidatus Regiella insecticola TaxID=138073 RepID=E0WUY0_9ENTR|nr:putative phage antirepressor [Candidatus Regiella insecticola LSR1]